MGRVEDRTMDEWATTLGWIAFAVRARAVTPLQAAHLSALIVQQVETQGTHRVKIELDDTVNIPLSYVDRFRETEVAAAE